MHHSQNNSRPSLQGKGKATGGHAGASILASVDGKAGRQRATNTQAAALGTSGQRRIWVWALPLTLVAVAVGGAVFWMQQPAELVASASSIPSADDRAANRSVEPVAFADATDTASTSLEAQTGAQIGSHSIDSHQTPAPSTGQTQGAYIEDASALASGASPFAALQAKANAPAEIASPFQALNEADKPKGVAVLQSPSAPRAAPTQAGQAAGGRVLTHQQPKQAARASAVASESPSQPSASDSDTGSAAPARSGTVLARTEPSRTESFPKRFALAPREAQSTTGASTLVASASSVIVAPIPARSPAESPAAANTVAAIKPAVTAIAASAAQAATSAAVAEVPTALGSGDPLNSLLKAAGHAAAAATAQGVSRLTRAETPQPTAAAGQPITAASAQSAAADTRKPTALEKSAVESRAAGRQADGGQVESAPAPSKKPNNKPEKAKTPDPDVTLMRALMRHLETPSK